VAVPNVTAIDWNKQTCTAPGSSNKGGKSFTVQEALVAFISCSFYLPASRWRGSTEDLQQDY
jgi:hypothetical protein